MPPTATAPAIAPVQDPAQWSISQRQMAYVPYAHAMDLLTLELVKKVVQGDIQPKDAIGTVKMIRGEAEASLAGLVAEGSAGQQTVKAAVSTPPETGVSTMLAQIASLSDTVAALHQLVLASGATAGGTVAAK